MNVIRRAIAGEWLSSSSSSSSPTKSPFFLIRRHPQHHQSLSLQKPSRLCSTWAEATTEAHREVELQKDTDMGFPRPREIRWQRKAANWVNLIGRIHQPVQFGASPDGKCWAGTILYQGDDGTNLDKVLPFGIPIIFEGDLAHIAACHLKATDYVHIAGLLSADSPAFTMREGQPNLQVMVHNINFVKGLSEAKKAMTSDNPEELDNFGTSRSVIETKPNGGTASDSWRDLLRSPQNWLDYRERKLSGSLQPKYPDFKHKRNGTALWVTDAPRWVLPGLNALKLDVRLPNSTQRTDTKSHSGDETISDPWRDLLQNPQNWLDNRLRKRNGSLNPKFPDFKHSTNSTPLWVDSAPSWVLPGLNGLKFCDPWKDLVVNPEKWWDKRTRKVNPKAPDFTHKDTNLGLWLDECPPSLRSSLPILPKER